MMTIEPDFLKDNQRLVHTLAKRFSRTSGSLDIEDLIQEGNIGLLHAMHMYDPARGVPFKKYAVWWVRSFIQQAILQYGRAVRMPEKVLHCMRAVRRLNALTETKFGRRATEEECAAAVKAPLSMIRRSKDASTARAFSLDVPMHEDGDTFLDSLESDDTSADDQIDASDRTKLAKSLLGRLCARDRRILLDRMEGRTLKEIGDNIGLTRERVRQIEAEAIRIMGEWAARETL